MCVEVWGDVLVPLPARKQVLLFVVLQVSVTYYSLAILSSDRLPRVFFSLSLHSSPLPPQAWSALLQPEVHSAFLAALPASSPPPQPQPAAPHAASVFRAVVEAALRDAAAGAHEVRIWECGVGEDYRFGQH